MTHAGWMDVGRSIIPPTIDQYTALLDWFGATVPPGASLLEVGAGPGSAVYQPRLAPLVGRWVGVDPDPSVARNPFLAEHHVAAIEDWRPDLFPDEPERFDAALAVYVVEHVTSPVVFLTHVRRLLSPGGSLFLVTPNLWHYFGVAALGSSRLGVDGRLLKRLRGDALVEEYHFPLTYGLNSVSRLAKAGEAAGFGAMEVRHLDDPGVFEGYFPARLRRWPSLWSAVVHRQRLGRLMGTLLVRLAA